VIFLARSKPPLARSEIDDCLMSPIEDDSSRAGDSRSCVYQFPTSDHFLQAYGKDTL
jgi:hypothetical protein